MADLRWAIGRYDEPGYDEWYIYDVKTDMTICDSPVRATLETILELLAALVAIEAVIRNGDTFIGMDKGDFTEWNAALDAVDTAIAAVKGDE